MTIWEGVMRVWLIAAALACAMGAQAQQLMVNPSTGETEEQFAARTAWWREAKFGMFIHWGIYSVPADATKGAEWYFNGSRMQVKDYEKFASKFNPVNFDANRWVRAAKNAGMKYIVITSKHHDGFCMYDSKLTDYCITKATPFKRDPLKELAAACRKQGIRLCFYHSIMDWHEPDYLPRRPWDTRPAAGASLDRYIEHMKGQLRELLTNYGPIGVIWFDGGWEHNAQELHSADVNKMIRSIQPGILINDRNQEPEDFSTPEQTIPANAMPNGRLWETCMTMNGSWGYARNDNNWKSSQDLIRKLCDIASKGGNFLLNVGPTDLGEMPPQAIQDLDEVGMWMKVNGASIYGTTKSPWKRPPFNGRVTQKGNILYLQVFDWPDSGLTLPGLQTPVENARVLGGGHLGVKQTADGVIVDRPSVLDSNATVVELTLAQAPVVTDVAAAVRPGAGGVVQLKAADAEIHGSAQYEQGGGRDNIGFWVNKADYVTWALRDVPGGRYGVAITYACEPGAYGSTYRVAVEGNPAAVSGTVAATSSWTDFKTEALGELQIPAGAQTVSVRVSDMPRGAVMNLKEIRLTPVK